MASDNKRDAETDARHPFALKQVGERKDVGRLSLGTGLNDFREVLLHATAAHQDSSQRLEVNTPDASAWPRTVAFYRQEGFAGGSYHLRKFL